MKINCYLSQGCVAEEALKTNIGIALQNECLKAEVNFYRIGDTKALSLGISGSPSVFINENELQPLGISGFS